MYWIDAKTGDKVPTRPIGTVDPLDPNHASGQGKNYVKQSDGSWIDAKTGDQVPTVPIGADKADRVDPNHASSQQGINYVRVPCPPPVTSSAVQPTRTATYSGLHTRASQTGPYVSVEGGVQRVNGIQISSAVGPAYGAAFHFGYDVGAAAGYRFGSFSGEVEGERSSSGLKTLDPPGGPVVNGAGSLENWSLMGNVIYDIMPTSLIDPFIGVGIGVNHLKLDDLRPDGATAATFSSNGDNALAWQAIAGLRAQVSHHVDLTVRYRFFHVNSLRAASILDVDSLNKDSLMGGITFHFSTPPK